MRAAWLDAIGVAHMQPRRSKTISTMSFRLERTPAGIAQDEICSIN
jgi:hypothetical protein